MRPPRPTHRQVPSHALKNDVRYGKIQSIFWQDGEENSHDQGILRKETWGARRMNMQQGWLVKDTGAVKTKIQYRIWGWLVYTGPGRGLRQWESRLDFGNKNHSVKVYIVNIVIQSVSHREGYCLSGTQLLLYIYLMLINDYGGPEVMWKQFRCCRRFSEKKAI